MSRWNAGRFAALDEAACVIDDQPTLAGTVGELRCALNSVGGLTA
jgi:hypothetical protein